MRTHLHWRSISAARLLVFFLAILVVLSACVGVPPTAVTNLPLETQIPLDGDRVLINFNLDWKYQPGESEGAEDADCDDSSWTYVDLPHTTKFVTPEDVLADLGVSWYRKYFTVEERYEGSKLFLEFEAAMQLADVWLNGEKLIRHEGGYTPFTIDITDEVIFDSENEIAVRIDNNANPDWAPGKNDIDFQFHGGIYRDVRLIVTDKLHITDAVNAGVIAGGGVFVTFPAVDSDSATADVKTHVLNEQDSAREATLVSENLDREGQIVASASSTVTIEPGSIVGPSTVTMKGGRLAVWVRGQRTAGTITLTASAPRLDETSVELTSLEVPDLPPLPADRETP